MTNDTAIVAQWIEEYRGPDTAKVWLWSCTPYPVGYASPEQLEEGLAVAAGELYIGDLFARIEAEMSAAMEDYND